MIMNLSLSNKKIFYSSVKTSSAKILIFYFLILKIITVLPQVTVILI